MSDDQFNQITQQFERLFTAISKHDQQLEAINHTLKTEVATRAQVNAVYDLLDKNIGEHQRQEEERAAMASQLKRLERWVKDIAEQTGITLKYE